MESHDWVVGIDIGGTFTDLVMIDNSGYVVTSKAPTTPTDPSQGVLDALNFAASRIETSLEGLLSQTARITHGSTIGTNTLLEHSGARLGLIITRGFEDTPFIMRAIGRVDGAGEERVRHLMALTKPQSLVEHDCVRGVTERIDVRGEVVVAVDPADVRSSIVDLVERQQVEAIAICLLNSWANPRHEQEVASWIRKHYSYLYCSASSEHVRLAGEYARMMTVLVDCYIGPRVHSYIRRLRDSLKSAGFSGSFLVMQGNGGLALPEECTAVATLQSGPVGGMIATAAMAGVLGHRNVLAADMGGTSFDVGIYADGRWRYAEEPIFDRYRMLQPIVDVRSIGAGGGTIARVDHTTGRLVVGPESAGAHPGPVCYNLGGKLPTVTDVDLLLGVLDPRYFLGGRSELRSDGARVVLDSQIASPLGLSIELAADGIRQIIDGMMADLIRRQVIESAYLPEDFVLYAFGGAAGAHVAEFAGELGIEKVYVFPTSPVFSAFGIAQADVRHTRVATCSFTLPCDPTSVNEMLATFESELVAIMAAEGFAERDFSCHRYLSLRFVRQVVNVEVELPWTELTDSRLNELADMFNHQYELLYGAGAGSAAAGVEISALRVDAVGAIGKPKLAVTSTKPEGMPVPKGTRKIFYGGSFIDARVYEWAALSSSDVVLGPAVIEADFTTVLVPPNSRAAADAYGNLMMNLTADRVDMA